MDPQNAQFFSLFVAPELIVWKATQLKEDGQSMTDDEVINLYREIQYLSSSAVSTGETVKFTRNALPAPRPDPEPEKADVATGEVHVTVERKPKPKPKKKSKGKRSKAVSTLTPEEKLNFQKRQPINDCKTPQGRLIRAIRYGHMMTQGEFAKTIRSHEVTMSQLERGALDLSPVMAERISKAFPEFTVAHLLTGIPKLAQNLTAEDALAAAKDLL